MPQQGIEFMVRVKKQNAASKDVEISGNDGLDEGSVIVKVGGESAIVPAYELANAARRAHELLLPASSEQQIRTSGDHQRPWRPRYRRYGNGQDFQPESQSRPYPNPRPQPQPHPEFESEDSRTR